MPLTGFYILIVGIMITFGSFLFAMFNMARGFHLDADADGFSSMFTRHLGAMVAMALGMFVALCGILLAVVQAIQTYA